jgi:hypothetical protein
MSCCGRKRESRIDSRPARRHMDSTNAVRCRAGARPPTARGSRQARGSRHARGSRQARGSRHARLLDRLDRRAAATEDPRRCEWASRRHVAPCGSSCIESHTRRARDASARLPGSELVRRISLAKRRSPHSRRGLRPLRHSRATLVRARKTVRQRRASGISRRNFADVRPDLAAPQS